MEKQGCGKKDKKNTKDTSTRAAYHSSKRWVRWSKGEGAKPKGKEVLGAIINKEGVNPNVHSQNETGKAKIVKEKQYLFRISKRRETVGSDTKKDRHEGAKERVER